MESGILPQTGAISRRFLAVVALLLSQPTLAAPAPLFDDDSVIDVVLSGPLWTISRERQDEDRVEYPFTLTVDGDEIPVKVRVRGHSRTYYCSFPPLRLNFKKDTADGTVFAGQDKLKLVTHCRSNKTDFEDNTLREYSAYRIFNVLSDVSYRVRLLRITYVDTDSKLGHLDHPYYGFVIEPDDGLADRVGGEVAKIEGVVYSSLNATQTSLMNVFQYLIANTDWSFVTHESEDYCCHNVDLIALNQELFGIPFDFDLAGIVDASYAKPLPQTRTRSVKTRVYRGYCRSALEDVTQALDTIVEKRDEIMALIEALPVADARNLEETTEYVGRFFEEATDDREELIEKFDRDCIGKR